MEGENSTIKKKYDRYEVSFCYLEETPQHKVGWTNLGKFKSYEEIAKSTGIKVETCKAVANNRCTKCCPPLKITKLPWKDEKIKDKLERKKAIADRIAANKAKREGKKKMVIPAEAISICDPLPM